MRRGGKTWNGQFAGLVVLCLLAGCAEQTEELISVPTEKEANRILVALETEGVKGGSKESGKAESGRGTVWKVKVPKTALFESRKLLVQLDLPREVQGGFEEMLKQGGLIPTKTDERAKLMHAMAGELARTFEAFDRVVQARVHLVIPEHDPLRKKEDQQPPRATVFIKYVSLPKDAAAPATRLETSSQPAEEETPRPTANGAQEPAWVKSREVRKMVLNSIEGIQDRDITVVYTQAAGWTAAAAAPKEPKPAEAGAAASGNTGGVSEDERKRSRTTLYAMLGALVAVGLIAIVSIFSNAGLRKQLREQRALARAEA